MNQQLVEFALRKQRLQIHLEMQRADLVRRLEGIEPALDTVDRVRDGVRWTRENIPILASTGLVLFALKPRLFLRVGRRVWLGWLLFRRLNARSGSLLGLVNRVRAAAARR